MRKEKKERKRRRKLRRMFEYEYRVLKGVAVFWYFRGMHFEQTSPGRVKQMEIRTLVDKDMKMLRVL